jgi:hypothetical protein
MLCNDNNIILLLCYRGKISKKIMANLNEFGSN